MAHRGPFRNTLSVEIFWGYSLRNEPFFLKYFLVILKYCDTLLAGLLLTISFFYDAPDIDECETGIHNCPPDFICQNTLGSFRCRPKLQCKSGFIQDALGNCIGKTRAAVSGVSASMRQSAQIRAGKLPSWAKSKCHRHCEPCGHSDSSWPGIVQRAQRVDPGGGAVSQ